MDNFWSVISTLLNQNCLNVSIQFSEAIKKSYNISERPILILFSHVHLHFTRNLFSCNRNVVHGLTAHLCAAECTILRGVYTNKQHISKQCINIHIVYLYNKIVHFVASCNTDSALLFFFYKGNHKTLHLNIKYAAMWLPPKMMNIIISMFRLQTQNFQSL